MLNDTQRFQPLHNIESEEEEIATSFLELLLFFQKTRDIPAYQLIHTFRNQQIFADDVPFYLLSIR
jgi:hypothetical protein